MPLSEVRKLTSYQIRKILFHPRKDDGSLAIEDSAADYDRIYQEVQLRKNHPEMFRDA